MKTGSQLTSILILTLSLAATAEANPCFEAPSGLVGWWRGENDALDAVGTNNGTLAGNTTYTAGRVGQAFVFDGSSDSVLVGNPTSLRLQDFTIEMWMKRASTTTASFDFNGGCLFAYGYGGYGFAIKDNGYPFLTRIGIDEVLAGTAITDTNFHHVAVTKSGTSVVFYIDGVPHVAPAYNPSFTFDSQAGIGGRGDNLAGSFFGSIDEVSVYNRALAANEIQAIFAAGSAGKCVFPCTPHAATATARLVNGFVVEATITDPGCGYTNAPTVLIQGGGGNGAVATATVSNGIVTAVNITDAGCCYTNAPKIVIGSPPFVPTVSIAVSKAKVTQNVVLGRKYVLEASTDLIVWTATGPPFIADSETIVTEFDVDGVGRFFRLREVP